MKKTYFITLISAFYTTTALSATPTCEEMPRCEDLGYSATISDSCENVLSCPFDTKYKICLDHKVIPTRGYCKIGDVFYSDLTCGDVDDYYDDGVHIPVGVVVYLTDESGNVVSSETSKHGRVINLHDLIAQSDYLFDATKPYQGVYTQIYWGLYGVSTPTTTYSVEAFKAAVLAAKGQEGSADVFDGAGRTKTFAAITKSDCSYTVGTREYAQYCISPVARAAVSFYPTPTLKDNPYVGAGKWYLPSKAEHLQMTGRTDSEECMDLTPGASCDVIFNPMETVNVTLNKLAQVLGSAKASSVRCYWYWSSTERWSNEPFDTNLCTGMPNDWDRKGALPIRLLLAF